MKKGIVIFCLSLLAIEATNAQTFTVDGSEIGIDLAFSASTNGGNVGLGLKYGFNIGEYLILGPSVRYERLWWKNNYLGYQGGYNIWGGGAFVHARFFNALFIGTEFEMLKTPYPKSGPFGGATLGGSWAPTLLIGGGFSMEFNETFRVNAGIMYDIIDAPNSPFQSSYMNTTTSTGAQKRVPVFYRLAFFFPIGRE